MAMAAADETLRDLISPCEGRLIFF